jgi:hypothetical protein
MLLGQCDRTLASFSGNRDRYLLRGNASMGATRDLQVGAAELLSECGSLQEMAVGVGESP